MNARESFSGVTTTPRVVIEQYGDANVLRAVEAPLPPPAAHEIRVRHTAIGVNYVDVYHRTGLYPLPSLPAVPGVEAAGVVEATGPGVDTLQVGQRIAYSGPPTGSYAAARNLPASRAIALPDDVPDDAVASLLLRGITTHMLLAHVFPLQAGQTVLVHAAAGGLGLTLVQWAKSMGAHVIGTVSTDAKAQLATAHGLDHAIRYRDEDFTTTVMRLTGGRGVDLAVDGIGGKTLIDTLGCVRPYGMVASVGQVAGDTGPLDLSLLGPARSVSFSRPGVFRFMSDPALYREGALATIRRLQSGLRPTIGTVLPLHQAVQAHQLLESGASLGSILLRP